jgi:Tol biopolymer transport system component
MSSGMLPIALPERAVRAATQGTVLGLTSQPVATAVTNGKVAFVGSDPGTKSDIYTMNRDGTDLRRLTFSSESDTQPAWSPDGTKIVFVRFSGPECYPYSKGGEIFVMNADGSDQQRLTQSTCERSDDSPTWSPDGAKIAFVNGIPPKNGLYVMNTNGSDQTRIITQGFVFGSPAWSPNGSKLAVEGQGRIFLINVDGSNPTAITNPTSSDPDFDPVWSPDGSKLLFSKWDCPYECWGPLGIWVVNADGSNQRMLMGEGASDQAWSPDGSKILFSKWTGRSIDLFAMNPDGSNVQNITNTDGKHEWSPSWQALLASTNPIDDPQYFVRWHYQDFLNREPDTAGWAFWTNEITSCGTDAQCIEIKRINVSAAFFLSIEFQQTGYFVYRMYKAAYGNMPGTPVPLTRQEFLPDTQRVGQGVIVGSSGWEQQLENNKNAYSNEFVLRSRFLTALPLNMTSEQFVDALNSNGGGVLLQSERDQLVSELASGAKSRAQVLRSVVEDGDLARNEFNKAFVLMQYFGYLRRNPNDPPDSDFAGYNFWLNKLDQFKGNFVQAEMVKAFITSIEYREKFEGSGNRFSTIFINRVSGWAKPLGIKWLI